MSLHLNAEQKNLRRLWSEYDTFVIPPYQRPYSWNVTECRQLYDDLIDAFNRPYDNDYFMGTIILAVADNQRDEFPRIVDGQQRMTTFWLMFKSLSVLLPEVTSLLYVNNTKCNDTFADLPVVTHSGTDCIYAEMEGLRFKVGPKSFYQTNSAGAYELYKVARDFAGLSGNELVYDLYTGTGTIANFVARQARQVVGIEYVPEAIADAKVNAQLNGLDNTLFYAGDMKDILTTDFIRDHGRPDVIITDPPRAGMHGDVVDVIRFAAPRRIVYVSCNPATQARDLSLLDDLYRVERVQPVDMFPHTHHVENVVLLVKREA